MERPALSLVKQILRSPEFLAQAINQQQVTLDQILATGEITREELLKIISEEAQKPNESKEDKQIRELLNSVDYNTFLTLVTSGQIRGKHLIALCNSSKKLNGYCNRSFQPVDNKGFPIPGLVQDQYLFRLLLNKMGVNIPYGKTPRQAYIDRTIGGQVWVFGGNNSGSLGLSDNINRKIPIVNPYLDLGNIIQVSCYNQSLALTDKGKVYCFGYNQNGELGLGDDINRTIPVLNPHLNNIVQVSAGYGYSLCLDNQGRVWSFGNNQNGRAGLLGVNSNIPTMLPSLSDIIQVSAGGYHSLCLDNQGQVWGFGYNAHGQLGIPANQGRVSPTMIPGLENIIQVSAGTNHSLFLDDQGRVWVLGNFIFGSLGIPGKKSNVRTPKIIPNLRKIVQVGAGYSYSVCLDSDGKIWSFGVNTNGQLGLGDNENRDIPTLSPNLRGIIQISVGTSGVLYLDKRGRVWGSGIPDPDGVVSNYYPGKIPGLDNITQVSTGVDHFLFIKK